MTLPHFAVGLAIYIALTLRLSAGAASVGGRNGNIVITDAWGEMRQLTSSGHDTNPVLSPDGRWVIFVRQIDGKKIGTGSDDAEPSELWQIKAEGSSPTRLLRSHEAKEMNDVIAGFENLQFSADGKLVYFITPAWAVSGAVHVVDTTNGKAHFVCAGNDLKIVASGEYRDCLLVNQHRYFVGGASYDWFWLIRPDGKEVGPVGEDTSNFESTFSDISKAKTK